MQAAKHDIKRGDENFLEPSGFGRAISLLLRVKESGLFFAAIPCGPWVWISRSRHKRSKADPFGDRSSQWVLQSTELVEKVCLLIMLAYVRRIYWICENPRSSCITHYPAVMQVMSLHLEVLTFRIYNAKWPLGSTFTLNVHTLLHIEEVAWQYLYS